MSEYIKKEDVLKILDGFSFTTKTSVFMGAIKEEINNLPTKQIEDDEFKIGQEVYSFNWSTQKVNKVFLLSKTFSHDRLLYTVVFNYNTDSSFEAYTYDIYKTRQAAEQALSEINKGEK